MGLIIAFIGKKGSGKSTACEYLMTDNTIRVNFKDALIREVKEKFPKLVQEIIDIMDKTDYDGMSPWTYERLVEEKPPLFRALLQNYGTDVCRNNNPDHWVTQYEEAVRNLSDFRILTDDIRFVNEADAVRARGGVLIRIIRTGLESTDTHISETEQDSIEADYTIKAGTKDELYTQLDSVMKLIGV
jgi:hypothetical protein